MAKYRLLVSSHQDDKGKTYEKGDIIEDTRDLCALFNSSLGAKFALLSEDEVELLEKRTARATAKIAAQNKGPDTLDAMSAQELRAHAAAEEIDLGNAQSKKEMIEIIRAAG